MLTAVVADRVHELAHARTPFVLATVVRAQAPTSVQVGDNALVLDDGTMEGYVGGHCTQNAVRTAALGALTGSAVTLLRVLPDDSDPFPATPGAQVVVNPCHSGGAVEIFLEPILPMPQIAVTGSTPIAGALRSISRLLGYDVSTGTAQDPPPVPTTAAAPPTTTAAPPTTAGRDILTTAELANCRAVILASHGPGEFETIRAALDAKVPYIGLVASRKRSTALFDDLGLSEAERARIDAPAGQWIGARTAPEIALSILTSVVSAIRLPAADPRPDGKTPDGPTNGAPSRSPDAAEQTPGQQLTPLSAVDPVCQMSVTVTPDTPHAAIDGVDYYFCNPGCRTKFLAERETTSARAAS